MKSCLIRAALGSRFLGLDWGPSNFGAPADDRSRSDVFLALFQCNKVVSSVVYVSAAHKAKDFAYRGIAVIRATNTMSRMGNALIACALRAGQKLLGALPEQMMLLFFVAGKSGAAQLKE